MTSMMGFYFAQTATSDGKFGIKIPIFTKEQPLLGHITRLRGQIINAKFGMVLADTRGGVTGWGGMGVILNQPYLTSNKGFIN